MRATYLQFRSPKERTPAPYYPLKANNGLPLNRFEYFGQSESLKGSFSQNHRFDKGSIYDYPFRTTTGKVGPGCYKDDDAVQQLKKKPCMSTYLQPQCGPDESRYEISGHLRVLCPNYLPRPQQASFDRAMDHYRSSRGRKMNETFVYSHAVCRTPNNESFFSRNAALVHTMSPEMRHVSRIRASHDKKFRDRSRELGLPAGSAGGTRAPSQEPSEPLLSADLVVGDKSARKLRHGKRSIRGSRTDHRADGPAVTVEPPSAQEERGKAAYDAPQHHSQKQIFYSHQLGGNGSGPVFRGQSGPLLADGNTAASEAMLMPGGSFQMP